MTHNTPDYSLAAKEAAAQIGETNKVNARTGFDERKGHLVVTDEPIEAKEVVITQGGYSLTIPVELANR